MQADYPARFVREMGCTAEELRAWLPGASRGADIQWQGNDGAVIALGDEPAGRLRMVWHGLPERRIALIRLPRLSVAFDFGGSPGQARHEFMRHFDLYTQRGGG